MDCRGVGVLDVAVFERAVALEAMDEGEIVYGDIRDDERIRQIKLQFKTKRRMKALYNHLAVLWKARWRGPHTARTTPRAGRTSRPGARRATTSSASSRGDPSPDDDDLASKAVAPATAESSHR